MAKKEKNIASKVPGKGKAQPKSDSSAVKKISATSDKVQPKVDSTAAKKASATSDKVQPKNDSSAAKKTSATSDKVQPKVDSSAAKKTSATSDKAQAKNDSSAAKKTSATSDKAQAKDDSTAAKKTSATSDKAQAKNDSSADKKIATPVELSPAIADVLDKDKAQPKDDSTDEEKVAPAKVKSSSKIQITKVFVFGVALVTFFFIGMMCLRPQISVLEKRKLAEFPEITFVGVWNGTFFKDLDIWYSDTYPLREEMIAADKKVENAYGARGEQIIEGKGDFARKGDPIKPVEQEPEENLPDGTVKAIGEIRGPIYIANNCGYEMYTFLEDLNSEFAQTMNNIYSRFKGVVDIYVMMVPTGAGVMLDKSVLDYLGTSDELAAVQFDYSKMDAGIKKVEVVSTLRRHNAEYVYFHTDHHWTALGAYYAYREFCKVKGIEPHDIKDYEKRELPGFLGSFYTESNQSPEIGSNPDTVIAYIPKGTNKITMVDENDNKTELNVINDMTGASPSEYYLTFVMGDAPLAYAHNETITDGSAVLVIKDSHGNAFVPWLVDHYEYVYWIDPRYTKNTISQMIRDYGIKDVIYEVGIYGASNPYMYGKYDQIGW